MSLAEKLKVLRARKSISQRELGRSTGVSYVTISKIEAGRQQSISAKMVLSVAKFFGVDPEDLLNDKVSTAALLTKLEQKAHKTPDEAKLDTVPLGSLLQIPVLARVPCGLPAEIPKELIVGRIACG